MCGLRRAWAVSLTLVLVPAGAWGQELVEAPKGEARVGDVAVRLGLGRVGTLRVITPGRTGEDTNSSCLYLVAVLANQSETRKVDYSSWMVQRRGVTVKDDLGNTYALFRLGLGQVPELTIGSAEQRELPLLEAGTYQTGLRTGSVHPGKVLLDLLVCERPVDQASHLLIELPADNLGGRGVLRFKVPRRFWTGALARDAANEAEAQARDAKQRSRLEAEAQARRAAADPVRKEKAAAASWALLKELLNTGKLAGPAARLRVERFVKEHAGTRAAEDAKALLKKL